jgi:hypothetical protein
MTTAYTTHDAVKTKLGLDLIVDAGLDAYLDSLILQVSSLFDTTVFGPVAVSGFLPDEGRTEYHDGGSDAIILSRLLSEFGLDRTTTLLIEEDGNALAFITGDWFLNTFPAQTIFRTSGTSQLDIVFDRIWAPGHKNIKVTYTLGYIALPDDVARACDEESARAFKAGTSDTGDGGFIALGGRTPEAGTTLDYTVDDLTPTTMRMLDGYRKRLSFY